MRLWGPVLSLTRFSKGEPCQVGGRGSGPAGTVFPELRPQPNNIPSASEIAWTLVFPAVLVMPGTIGSSRRYPIFPRGVLFSR